MMNWLKMAVVNVGFFVVMFVLPELLLLGFIGIVLWSFRSPSMVLLIVAALLVLLILWVGQ